MIKRFKIKKFSLIKSEDVTYLASAYCTGAMCI
ncbi:hypothetical protein NTE_01871 [Candidatus Nitrososphaera evergladensis SR1]|uniref:Uncharacterized protein n=1 Tax=Candidatus Nitrososphaera evergladensis SR1 TaxID=1459636 RepID=A0A075MQV7_9ARCH|nr:hypothetical protein NTE_01871 [Candidatus Nitrososphaera evergladensis SR1]